MEMPGYYLLPCPFCGGKAELRHDKDGFSYIVCPKDGCYCRTDGHLNDISAVNSWNRRVNGGLDMKYTNFIMEMKRMQLGLAPNDTSRDSEIEESLSNGDKMSKSSTDEIDKVQFWKKSKN